MITTKHGSIFDSTAQVLVCPVNCVGVMGKGLALEFRRRWPRMFIDYRSDCLDMRYKPGYVYEYDAPLQSKTILCAATKDHWRDPSNARWVEDCLKEISFMYSHHASIAIPQLGCGCGGLDWSEVWPLYEKHLGGLDADVEVWIHE